jgi:hypothetical protein
MRRPFLYILLYFTAFVPASANSQTAVHYTVQYLGAEDGLTDRGVVKVYEGHNGFLWIATGHGLYKYDGISISLFNNKPQSLVRLPENVITSVAEDTYGRLWICTRLGLCVLDQNRYELFPGNRIGLPDSVCNQKNCSVFREKDGRVVLLSGNSLYSYKDGQLRLEHAIQTGGHAFKLVGPAGPDAYYLLDERQTLFLLDHQHLISQNFPIKITDPLIPEHNLDKNWTALLYLQPDSLLITTETGRILHRKTGTSGPFYELGIENELAVRQPAWKAVQDFATQTGSPIDKSVQKSLRVHDVLYSPSGYWVFGTNYGLFIVKPQAQYFHQITATLGKSIRGIIEDADENLLIGAYDGNLSFDLKQQSLKPSFNPADQAIWGFISAGKDSFWSCQENDNGIQLIHRTFSGRFEQSMPAFPGKLKNSRSFAKTPHGFWTGRRASQLYFIDDTNHQITPSPLNTSSTNPRWIRASLYSPKYGLWTGADDGVQLFSLDPQTDMIREDLTARLPVHLRQVQVNALYETTGGAIMIGTNEEGLFVLDPVQWKITQWTTDDGLPNNTVYSILGSNNDSIIWLGTQNGLSRLDLNTITFQNYFKEDGLTQNEFNTAARYQSPDGTVYFGGVNGISCFRPEWIPAIHENIKICSWVVLIDPATKVSRLFGLENGQTVKVDPNEQLIEFQIRSNDLPNQFKTNLLYKIDEVNQPWNILKAGEKVVFSSLSPGKHVLTFRVRTYEGHLSEVYTVTLQILPPWYQTWWFRSLVLLSVSGALYWAYQIRLRHIKREFEIRRKVVHDLHDELGSRLYAMKTLASRLIDPKQSDANRETISKQFEELSKTSIRHMREFIWAFDPKNENLDAYLNRLEDFMEVTIKPIVSNSVFIRKHIPSSVTNLPKARHNSILLYQELLTNMIKHTHSSAIAVVAEIQRSHLHLVITNHHNGIAQTEEAPYPSFGLQSIANRLQNNDIQLREQFGENIQTFELILKIS